MASRLRKMKPYHPRKRIQGLALQKQALHDIQHKMSSDIGRLIVFIEEKNTLQIPVAQQKAKTDFLKYAPEMRTIAQKMGERYAAAVREYLDSIDTLVHSNASWIDEAKVRHCQQMTQKLAKEIAA